MPRATTHIRLAGGLWRGEDCERVAVVEALDAETQRTLVDELDDALPAERVTALLAQAVTAVGRMSPVSAGDIRALRIGDRDQLVLALHGLLVGGQIETVFACSHDGCGEQLEVELAAQELAAQGGDAPLPREASRGELVVRPATGADHERAARMVLEDPTGAAKALLENCVVERGGEGAVPDAEIAALLASLDPGADLLLESACPACGGAVAASLDPITHLWTGLQRRRDQLEYDIHRLAFHYHWSEAEIVGLGEVRRGRYLAQLDRALDAR